MKKLALLGILIVTMAATAPAQTTRPFSFYAGGGIGIPISPEDFKDGWDMGFHGKLAIGYRFPSVQNFEFQGKFEYHQFNLDTEDDDIEGGDFRPLLFGVDAKYAFGLPTAPTRPYLLGGLGLAVWEFTDSDLDSESDLYLNGGVGIDFSPAEAFGVFVEGRFTAILTEGDATTFIPITAGFKF